MSVHFWSGESELWAVVHKESGVVLWSRGGSSTKARLMVYPTPGKARTALASRWIKQYLGDLEVEVRRIYTAEEDE